MVLRYSNQFLIPKDPELGIQLFIPSDMVALLDLERRFFYLITPSRNRFKIYYDWNEEAGDYLAEGDDWTDFYAFHNFQDAAYLHFIEESDLTFYVTAYRRSGIEVGRSVYGHPMARLLLTIEDQNELTPPPFFFEHTRVLNIQDVVIENKFGDFLCRLTPTYSIRGPQWIILLHRYHAEEGFKVIVTQIDYGTYGLNFFDQWCNFLGGERVHPTRINDNFVANIHETDPKMYHFCRWWPRGDHDHFSDHMAFYKSITDNDARRGRLTIPADFVRHFDLIGLESVILRFKDNEDVVMQAETVFHPNDPEKDDHIIVKGPLRDYCATVGLTYGRVIRFRLKRTRDPKRVCFVLC